MATGRIREAKIWRAAYGASDGSVDHSLFVAKDEQTANAYVIIRSYVSDNLDYQERPVECGRIALRPEVMRNGTAANILSGNYVGEFEDGSVRVVSIKQTLGDVTFIKTPRKK